MNTSAARLIREQRDRRGLSQAQVAEGLGVTKNLLSMFESGKRAPTEEQVTTLSTLLGIPAEILRIGSGRLPPDVERAIVTDAAGVVAAVRQQTEARAIAFPTGPETIPVPSRRRARVEAAEQIPEWVHVSKTTTSYRAHSYHTKVPPDAIRPFIRALTSAGDTVLDPFCGSGMTGVAALMEGRNALLSDLSPAAVHIATNYTTPCDPVALHTAFKTVEAAVFPTIQWLYRTVRADRMVEYTTWSDQYQCRSCSAGFSYWDAMHSGAVESDRIRCPKCSLPQRKTEYLWVGELPVQSHTSSGSTRIDSHEPTAEELALIQSADSSPIPYWTPSVPFGEDREMWRAAHTAMGISDVSGFFTRRNLHALSALRHSIVTCTSGRIREALMFAFTAAVNRASKRYQWNAKRPTNVMTGTLYVSSLRYEWNVWSLFRRKFSDVLKYFREFPKTTARSQVFQRSATDLQCIPDGAVDMVFMDPPFGSNIFYADSSLLWDAWLGVLTDQGGEIVVNRHKGSTEGGKNLAEYETLLGGAFSEVSRVLKRSGRAVLAFSNSDDQVWQSVQRSLKDAGLKTEKVHVLNKGQPSIKGVKGHSGKESVTTYDLLLVLQGGSSSARPRRAFKASEETAAVAFPEEEVRRVVTETLRSSGQSGCRTDELYSAVVRAVLQHGRSLAGVTMRSVASQCAEIGAKQTGGKWIVLEQVHSGAEKQPLLLVDGYLEAGTLPASRASDSIQTPIPKTVVPGTRSSALYSAHSYHTKVPPEAITPFIEHYTKLGDVVMDPFCGSGMTGVAASLAGRRCILNDLAPAAIHLAWNHTRPCDPEALDAAFQRLESALAPAFDSMYAVTHLDGREGHLVWTLWSTRHRCVSCNTSFLLWDAVDKATGRVGASVNCPSCGHESRRAVLPKEGSEPAWLAYEVDGKRFERAPSAQEVKAAKKFRRGEVKAWYPEVPISADREMYIRCALHLQNIDSVADFYTARNLNALALLWEQIGREADSRLRAALAFAFTNTAWHGTRMRRFNARGGQRPLTGTLYIPQLSSEVNVLEVMRNKIQQLKRYYAAYSPRIAEAPSLLLGSASKLRIDDESVDYVFTDPPFGSNIFYADCNAIWEAWLGRLTDGNSEAVVNRSKSPEDGGKTLQEYSQIMAMSMTEMYRVLKKGGWATIVFHNTDANVWSAIHEAAERAGFEFHEASSLDRKQQSHKGYKGRSGVEDVAHFDVIFNLRKPAKPRVTSSRAPKRELADVIRAALADDSVRKKGIQGVHSEVMRQLASRGEGAYADFAEVRKLCETVIQSGAEQEPD
jgi:DNA modification methylase/transcriptional regulator with XRE-family HTH domain/DNA-directed RNA polymerase subunit RPC12/RpoP